MVGKALAVFHFDQIDVDPADPVRGLGAFRCIDAGQLNGERLTRLTHPDRVAITDREHGDTDDDLDADGYAAGPTPAQGVRLPTRLLQL